MKRLALSDWLQGHSRSPELALFTVIVWLNKLNTRLANQTAPKGMIMIVCKSKIRKMTEHSKQ